jgi:hypothetical protein
MKPIFADVMMAFALVLIVVPLLIPETMLHWRPFAVAVALIMVAVTVAVDRMAQKQRAERDR